MIYRQSSTISTTILVRKEKQLQYSYNSQYIRINKQQKRAHKSSIIIRQELPNKLPVQLKQ